MPVFFLSPSYSYPLCTPYTVSYLAVKLYLYEWHYVICDSIKALFTQHDPVRASQVFPYSSGTPQCGHSLFQMPFLRSFDRVGEGQGQIPGEGVDSL